MVSVLGFVVPSLKKRIKYATIGLFAFSALLFVGDIALDAYTGKKLSTYVTQPIFRAFCNLRPNEDCLRRLSEKSDDASTRRLNRLTEEVGAVRAALAELERIRRNTNSDDTSEPVTPPPPTAFSELEIVAADGDLEAKFELGFRLIFGVEGDPHDPETGVQYWVELAENGHLKAQESLGWIYKWGMGVESDLQIAKKWSQLAFDNGSSFAATQLGELLLLNSENSSDDAAVGFEMLLQSAQNNDELAQFYVGYAYENGLAVIENDFNAASWYEKSANNGWLQATLALAELYADRDSDVYDLSKSLKWYESAAAQDHLNALHQTGVYHLLGMGTEVNKTLGVRYLTLAAEKGSVGSQYTLGMIYLSGDPPVQQDYEKAAKWLQQATGDGLPQAHYALATMYEKGQGVRKSEAVAFEHYMTAAELGFEPAEIKVASAIAFGIGTTSDPKRGFEMFLELAEKGNLEAMAFLGLAYQNGFGVAEDSELAHKWMKRAAEAGSQEAQEWLSKQ